MAGPRRHALIAGAAGRLGEALLAQLLVTLRYDGITVLTNGPLASTVRGLRPLAQAAFLANPGLANPGLAEASPAVELDVYLCTADGDDPLARAPNRRDAIYAPLADLPTVRALAGAAAAAGARRLLLIAPLAAWRQTSAASRMLPQALELELARLAVPTVVVLRPVTERAVELNTAAESATVESRLQRFARFYLSQLRFMLPSAGKALRAVDIARIAIGIMAESDRPGLAVVPPDRIRQHAEAAGTGRNPPPAG
ncbi:MAG: hypothetical protein AB7G13_01625 [Lautropia sp.]